MIINGGKVIRVLVVDDSRVAAEMLTQVINADRQLKVVGVASDGEQAIEAAQRISPDVITMDIHMPKLDGYEATRRIMETCPVPIVIVSGALRPGEVAEDFRAIEAGALAVTQRPAGVTHPDHETQLRELLDTVKLMSEVKVVRRWRRGRVTSAIPEPRFTRPRGTVRAVAIGASTGGPLVLQTILSNLPKDFSVPLLIVQHMTPGFVEGFVEWLARASGFPISVAVAGEPVLPGHAYVAPDKYHLGVGPGEHVLLSPDIREHGMRPAVSFLFRSIHDRYGPDAAAVLLTGMGKDGVEELKLLKDVGAVTIVQDKETSVVHGMPGQAIEIGAAIHVLPPERIARILAVLVNKS